MEKPDHLPFWEQGSGHYGCTLGQLGKSIIQDSQDLVLSFIDSMELQTPSLFTVADYGTNDGYTSMLLITEIIKNLRSKHGEKVSVQVIYEDQEGNDFNSLFNRLSDKTSYMSEFTNVFPFASCVNFYKQCVPDETCHVIFTCLTTHWQDCRDCFELKNYVFYSLVPDDDVETHRSVSEVAERNWTKFLLLRAKELKRGGLLIVFSPSAFNKHSQSASTSNSQRVMGQSVSALDLDRDLDTAWRQLRDEQIITQEELEGCVSKLVFRTEQEITAPFTAVTSLVKEAGLEMVYHDQKFYPFPGQVAWQAVPRQERQLSDHLKSFARSMREANRVRSDTSFRNSLSDTRTPANKDAILDLLFDKFEALVLKCDPDTYQSDVIISRLVVRKI